MKYAQLIMGLLIGTALGGAVVASQGTNASGGGAVNEEAVKQIVRDTIMNEPKLIMDSVQKYQQQQQAQAAGKASEVLKDPAVTDLIFRDDALPFAGNKDGKNVIAEFFDYNCPVCKMQFKVFTDLLAKDKDLKIVFHEFPIFGPVSDQNSKIGLAVAKLYPAKYYTFHEKMMEGRGHEENNDRTLLILKDLGFDVAKVQEVAQSDEVAAQLDKSRDLGQKLNIRGTPTLVVGDEVIGHAVDADALEAKLSQGE
jgi:protein-disulfide isomerase